MHPLKELYPLLLGSREIFGEIDLYVNGFFGIRRHVHFRKDSRRPVRTQRFCGNLLLLPCRAHSKLSALC